MARMTEEELAARSAKNKAAWGKVSKFKPLQPLKPTKAEKFAKIKLPTEHQEQVAVIAWCDAHPVAKNIFAIPNGAHKSPATAAKFKREGLRKGVPDLFLPVARRGYHGLFIELKRAKGSKMTFEQIDWSSRLTTFGYNWHLCHGADEAIAVIQEYIKET